MPNTKIIATLGPASDSPELIRRLLEEGVDVFRLNAAHGSRQEHAERIRRIREASPEPEVRPGILLDLQGPKIRLGVFQGGGVTLETGAEFVITTEAALGTSAGASTNYPNLAREVKPGDRVLLADGSVELEALSSDGTAVRCRVVSGGPVADRKGINLPGVRLGVPSLTEKDLEDLAFAVQAGADLLGLSFVRSAGDVRALRERLREAGSDLPIVAKIEKPEAWENLEEILAACDGVMVARGDLGVELALEKVPYVQKAIIHRARRHGRFVITATQMLESMVENPYPTRAEVSDVANSIYDGTDAVMLSAETSVGRHPVEAVRMTARIVKETERSLGTPPGADAPVAGGADAGVLAEAAVRAARCASAAALAVFTVSGSSARLLAAHRPAVPIYAFTPRPEVARRLAPVFGVRPILTPPMESTDQMLAYLEQKLLAGGLLGAGRRVVFVAGQPLGRPGTTNLLKLHLLGA